MQGPQGPTGPAWLYQPSAADLLALVKEAVNDVSARTVLDPRAAARYVANVTSRLIKLQGGLLLKAIVTTDGSANEVTATESNVRYIA